MKSRFEFWFRGFLVVLVVSLFWSVWASAQQANPASAGATSSTISAGGLISALGGIDEDHLSFELKRTDLLREHKLFGEPLWKYFASLIYLFLAFHVLKFLDYLTRVGLKRLADRTKTKFDDLLSETRYLVSSIDAGRRRREESLISLL